MQKISDIQNQIGFEDKLESELNLDLGMQVYLVNYLEKKLYSQTMLNLENLINEKLKNKLKHVCN